ncbi:hypothetical protein F4780DRAFT_272391 [Xylariomycetidae sp. FL0641]|nr:hypothetical protein F4780DRAFT_272391 [Xylariomycetidae sp. FL0641]
MATGSEGFMARGVPPFPPYLLFIKATIILLSIIILGLAAYELSLYGDSYYSTTGVPGFLIFLSIFSWIVYGGATAVELKAPHLYYRIVVLAAYILLPIFWISGWAWAASWASYVFSFDLYGDGYGGWKSFGAAMGASAGIGAIIWILSLVVLGIFCHACLRRPESTRGNNFQLGSAQHGSAQQPSPHQALYATQQQYAVQPLTGGRPPPPRPSRP